MASMTMTAPLGSSMAAAICKQPLNRRVVVAVKASEPNEVVSMKIEENKSSNGRREMVFAAAAAAVYAVIAKGAMAEEDEPKPGSIEAKKKYAPICVTMPTARICHK